MHLRHNCRHRAAGHIWLTSLPKDRMSHVNTPLPSSVGWHWTDAGKRRGVSGSSMHALTAVSNEKAAEDAGSRIAAASSLACVRQSRPSNYCFISASEPVEYRLRKYGSYPADYGLASSLIYCWQQARCSSVPPLPAESAAL